MSETPAKYSNGSNAPAVQQKAPSAIEGLKSILSHDNVKTQFNNVLEKSAPTFMASIIDLFVGDTNLQKCNPSEVVAQCLKAAVLKLPINKALGFAYIIGYNNNKKNADGTWSKVMQPTFQLGYKGLIQLAMRTGQYRIINADKVYDGELQSVNKLTGEINFEGEKKSETVVGYFAYIEMLNGFSKTLYRTKEDVISHAKRFSKSYGTKSSPWETDFDAMALKTVISNLLSHYGFLSVEMMGVVESEATNDAKESYQQEVDQNANSQVVDFEDVAPEQIQQETEQTEQVDEATGEIFSSKPGF